MGSATDCASPPPDLYNSEDCHISIDISDVGFDEREADGMSRFGIPRAQNTKPVGTALALQPTKPPSANSTSSDQSFQDKSLPVLSARFTYVSRVVTLSTNRTHSLPSNHSQQYQWPSMLILHGFPPRRHSHALPYSSLRPRQV